jgi:hypothetical protein
MDLPLDFPGVARCGQAARAFVKGAVVGGASELQRLIDSGESPRMLAG